MSLIAACSLVLLVMAATARSVVPAFAGLVALGLAWTPYAAAGAVVAAVGAALLLLGRVLWSLLDDGEPDR